MNMREFGRWLVSNPGKLIIAIVAIGLMLCVIFTMNHAASQQSTKVETPQLNPRVTQKDYNLAPAVRSNVLRQNLTPSPPPQPSMVEGQQEKTAGEKRTFRPLRFGSLPQERPQDKPVTNSVEAGSPGRTRDWSESAPYGRMLHCHLVNSVTSSNLETPVIGLVDEDFWWGHKLLIPANSEVHGVATGEKVRDRIGCDTNWVIDIYDPRRNSRKELRIQGVALDKDKAPTADPADLNAWAHFGLTDGSAGLRGDIVVLDVKRQLMNKAELFASAFLSGFALSFQNTSQTVYGFQAAPTTKNAALAGAGSVMSEYADDLRKKIETDAEYVQVMGSKQFYLYVQQTLDVSRAKEGLMLPRDQGQGSEDFGPSASQIYRRLYRRQEDERQQQLGPYAGLNGTQDQMKALQLEISKMQPPGFLPTNPNPTNLPVQNPYPQPTQTPNTQEQ
jgi:hypothetical protein